MPRTANPNREPVESMVMRTITIATYEVSYLPKGEKTVSTARETLYNNEQIAKREIRRKYKDMGIITDIVLVESHSELYGAKIEDYLKIAKPIKRTVKTESEVNEDA